MSLIVLWKRTRVGAWVKIKMSGGTKNTSILYIIIIVMHGYRTKTEYP